jgi:FixJ family two-component response regulator
MIPEDALRTNLGGWKRGQPDRARFYASKRIVVLPEVTMMIAIVEDDASVRAATQSLVRSLGFAACSFSDAEEFLRSPCATKASCLIADVQMPGMSGIDLQSILCDRGCDTPIIFITAFSNETIRARAMKAGAVSFLDKPVDVQTLIASLDQALNRRK